MEEKERNREDRRRKAEKEKLTFKCGFAQKKITTFLKNLPSEARRNFESEEERKRRVKLKEIKETMWKRTRKEGENLQTGEDNYKNLTELENKLKNLEAIQKECEREEKERTKIREEREELLRRKGGKKEERLKLKKKL